MTTPPIPSITDEQIAELERDANQLHPIYRVSAEPMRIISLIARLRSAEKDAGRMQFLEDSWGGHSGRDGGFHVAIYMPKEAETLREMTDAAMQEQKP